MHTVASRKTRPSLKCNLTNAKVNKNVVYSMLAPSSYRCFPRLRWVAKYPVSGSVAAFVTQKGVARYLKKSLWMLTMHYDLSNQISGLPFVTAVVHR